jgi:hypothetical protein
MKLKELGKLMIDQDPMTLFYKYKQTHPDEKDACNKLLQLPMTITGIQAFMNGFLTLSGGRRRVGQPSHWYQFGSCQVCGQRVTGGWYVEDLDPQSTVASF